MEPIRTLYEFQYMLLLRGATGIVFFVLYQGIVSIHAPLARSNQTPSDTPSPTTFQYMLLLRGATSFPAIASTLFAFQYMLLLRGATGRF